MNFIKNRVLRVKEIVDFVPKIIKVQTYVCLSKRRR